ncbi:MAG TPA: 4-alpha-glucanotransferase [Candidatus Methanoperedens sp.]|nr:4-alpha-glucanotransferase [Candidatus Methanoperedens sp.]
MSQAPTHLELLAGACGIEPAWRDNWGTVHPTAPRTAAGLLAAMGIAAEPPAAARRSLARLSEAAWCETLPPVLVVRAAVPPERFPVALPRSAGGAGAGRNAPDFTVELIEEGGARRGASHAAGEITSLGTRRYRSGTWERFGVPLPRPFPLGYHALRVTTRRGGHEVLAGEVPLIACPERCWSPPEEAGGGRAAGLGVALYGLRSGRNAGVGDIHDLRRLTRWAVRELGVSFIGLNPLHATRNRFPHNHSPYLPLSGLFANHLYLALEEIPDFAASAEARALMARGGGLLARLRAAEHVPYDAADRFKLRVLRALFAEFLARCWHAPGGSGRRRRFEDYLAREGAALERFALFRALDAHLGTPGSACWSWRLWPEEYRRPDAPGARAFLAEHREAILFWQYLQWQLDEQLADLDRDAREAGLSLGYYHDLAMAVDEHGADAWSDQALFAEGARVGAPPDDFNAAGQDWGFPPPHPEADRSRGYPAFREQVRRACRHAGLLRIDHVMRLARLFWIPAGLPAAAGAYVRYRRDELFGIVALESVRNRTVIVGEDLGVVPDGFREEMAAAGLCSCRLLWFERRNDGAYLPPEAYPRDAMVSITTHDLATLAGFWSDHDLETRREIGLFTSAGAYAAALAARAEERRRLAELLVGCGLLGTARRGDPAPLDGELHNAVVTLLCQTPSRYFLLSQEDLFKVADQQNVPGTVTERPNWVWRMPWTVEQLETAPAILDFARMYRENIRRSGRG